MAQSILIQKPSKDFVFAKADEVTGALQNVSTDHAAIHASEGFSCYAISSATAYDATFNVTFKTAASKYVHLKIVDVWNGDGKVDYKLYEAPESVTGGTLLPVVNRNRAFPEISGAVLKSGVTLTTLATARTISAVSIANSTFSVAANLGTTVKVGDIIAVASSTGNDGLYHVTAVTAAATSIVTVAETIADATVDGTFTVQRTIDGYRQGGPATATNPGNSSSPGAGGSGNLDIEHVLRQDTTYVIHVDNVNAAEVTQDISVWLYWYEEEKGQ